MIWGDNKINMTKETVTIKIPKDCIPPECEDITELVKNAIHYSNPDVP